MVLAGWRSPTNSMYDPVCLSVDMGFLNNISKYYYEAAEIRLGLCWTLPLYWILIRLVHFLHSRTYLLYNNILLIRREGSAFWLGSVTVSRKVYMYDCCKSNVSFKYNIATDDIWSCFSEMGKAISLVWILL